MDPTPDIVVGRHPVYGIVAANPRQSDAADLMLDRLGFRPVPGSSRLRAVPERGPDAVRRTGRAVAALRAAGYTVATDLAFVPEPADAAAIRPAMDAPDPWATRRVHVGPAITFHAHPALGLVATTSTLQHPQAHDLLAAHGFRHNPQLSLYTLPITTSHTDALAVMATVRAAARSTHLATHVDASLTPATPAPTGGPAIQQAPRNTAGHHGPGPAEPDPVLQSLTARVYAATRPAQVADILDQLLDDRSGALGALHRLVDSAREWVRTIGPDAVRLGERLQQAADEIEAAGDQLSYASRALVDDAPARPAAPEPAAECPHTAATARARAALATSATRTGATAAPSGAPATARPAPADPRIGYARRR